MRQCSREYMEYVKGTIDYFLHHLIIDTGGKVGICISEKFYKMQKEKLEYMEHDLYFLDALDCFLNGIPMDKGTNDLISSLLSCPSGTYAEIFRFSGQQGSGNDVRDY